MRYLAVFETARRESKHPLREYGQETDYPSPHPDERLELNQLYLQIELMPQHSFWDEQAFPVFLAYHRSLLRSQHSDQPCKMRSLPPRHAL